jgi:hypothetical protein
VGIQNPSLVEILDELVSQGLVSRINFAGAGVVATVAGGLATITIAGGGGPGGGSATTVEVNVGATPISRGKFIITDAGITGTSKVIVAQAPGPYTGKGTRADEAEMDPLWCVAEPGAGQAIVYWATLHQIIDQGWSEIARRDAILSADASRFRTERRVIGKVKGNIKFTYQVFA